VIRHVGIRAVARIQTGINYSGIPGRFSMERDIDPIRRAAPADARSRAGDRPVQSPNEETMHVSALTRKNRDDPLHRIEEGGESSRHRRRSYRARDGRIFSPRRAARLIKEKAKRERKRQDRREGKEEPGEGKRDTESERERRRGLRPDVRQFLRENRPGRPGSRHTYP